MLPRPNTVLLGGESERGRESLLVMLPMGTPGLVDGVPLYDSLRRHHLLKAPLHNLAGELGGDLGHSHKAVQNTPVKHLCQCHLIPPKAKFSEVSGLHWAMGGK